MPNIVRFALPALAAVLVTVSAGCSGGGPGGSGLEAALARVSDTAGNQSAIYYDNTAELVSLAGKSPSAKGFGLLRGMGAGNLTSFATLLPRDTGISLLDEDYAISAGAPPAGLTLVAGGQSDSLVTGRMTRLGWKKDAGSTLTSPPMSAVSPGDVAVYTISMKKVRAANSDVLIGGASADLSKIGSPSGPTLADDPGIKAIADCLGNVVAAQMYGGKDSNATAAPTEAAVGVIQPDSATAAPHAVVCVSWPTQQAADAYEANVRKALATGSSLAANVPFSTLLHHATVTSVGGGAHIVEWQADPENVGTVFQMQLRGDLPALPNCDKMAPAVKQQIIGCH